VAIKQNSGALRTLGTLFNVGAVGGQTDGELLGRFVARRDGAAELAFAALVERHGPMVLSVCRTVLRDENDAHDAFQATFLVLVHKAGSLRVRETLGPWLHAVAVRVASCARSAAARRRRHEANFAGKAPGWSDGTPAGVDEDLGRILHEEIRRLPERYRIPVVLCDLEGRSHQQASRALGWPVGTVKSRQARGRARLRQRLTRRGLATPAGLVSALTSGAARAAVPPATAGSTVQAALRFGSESGVVSARVTALKNGALKVMVFSKFRSAALVAALAGASLALTWGAVRPAPAAVPQEKVVAAAPSRKPAGKIYFTAGTVGGAKNSYSVVGIDPETREQTTVLDGCQVRPRVSPNGRTVAYSRDDALWVRSLAGGDEPKKILDLKGSTGGTPPVWSPAGRQIVISLAEKKEPQDQGPWVFETVRVNVDGSERTELPIPHEDVVLDWSSDGKWLLTASSRNAKIGWQLYVMRPDGSDQRQVTEGGNPFFARFSPDGRRLLYTDGTTDERRGIWVVGFDGKDPRRVLATGGAHASACWSPDGKRIAAVVTDRPDGGQDVPACRLVVVDLDGGDNVESPLPEARDSTMPDWR